MTKSLEENNKTRTFLSINLTIGIKMQKSTIISSKAKLKNIGNIRSGKMLPVRIIGNNRIDAYFRAG